MVPDIHRITRGTKARAPWAEYTDESVLVSLPLKGRAFKLTRLTPVTRRKEKRRATGVRDQFPPCTFPCKSLSSLGNEEKYAATLLMSCSVSGAAMPTMIGFLRWPSLYSCRTCTR